MKLENEYYEVLVDQASGAIASLVVKPAGCDLIGEKRLIANFRICLPLPDYQCNYIDGMAQRPSSITQNGEAATIAFSELRSVKGVFRVDLSTTIALSGDAIVFRSRLTNHDPHPISEFWYPRLGGWTRFGTGRDAGLAVPSYRDPCRHTISLFKGYPGGRSLGAEAAEWSQDYPGMVMPWWDIYDKEPDLGLYLGYHDPVFRLSTWHTYLHPIQSGRPDAWLTPEEAAGYAVGLTFSHVRYPYIRDGETLEAGEFVLRVHKGDWHEGVQPYRAWFMAHFPFDKSQSWLRKESAWFSTSLLQPEDRVVNDYDGCRQWCEEAQPFGINTFEIIGWDKAGWERDYPEYFPEPRFGGREAFGKLMRSLGAQGGHPMPFVNWNVLDQNSDWYKTELHRYTHQDEFGSTPNWMCWGQSTLVARKRMSVRRHVLSSIVPRMEEILTDYFVDLARDGAHGLQVDKVCVGSVLDFNPLNTLKPDVALCEGLVQSIGRMLARCREIAPEFCLAAEATPDRLIPYVDVYYRSALPLSISALRYVFPEWTACVHISAPNAFRAVNGAVMNGAAICIEPHVFQGSLADPLYATLARYIAEVGRMRRELAEIIFLGRFLDDHGASITAIQQASAGPATGRGESPAAGDMPETPPQRAAPASLLHYRVHEHAATGRRAIVVINDSDRPTWYRWAFAGRPVAQARLYRPFQEVATAVNDAPLEIQPEGLHILVEPETPLK